MPQLSNFLSQDNGKKLVNLVFFFLEIWISLAFDIATKFSSQFNDSFLS